MGTQSKRFRIIRNLDKLENTRQNIQNAIDKNKSIEKRRKNGQFATSFTLAKEIVSHGLELLDAEKVCFLEPAIGTGAFFSAFLQKAEEYGKKLIKATGVEIDPDIIHGIHKIWNKTDIEILNADFTCTNPNGKYNFVIANPPYVRHHYILKDKKSFLKSLVHKEMGINMSGLSGLYCYFIPLAHKWLTKGAISGWLVPSEFMDVNYGNAIKMYLLEKVHLLRIHRYAPEDLKFKDALVSSCVVWFKNEIVTGDYDVEFSYSGTHEKPLCRNIIKKSELLSERKWTRFPEKQIRNIQETKITIGDYFTIKRGLVTGDNNFFILTKKHINELKLDMKFFKPVLPSPRYLKSDLVETDKEGRPKIEQEYYLLDCKLTEYEIQKDYPELWKYLQSGISKTSEKYLCRNRKIWYWQEQREATMFLCSYMGRGNIENSPIRFILNMSNAIATNSYLMLYPKENLKYAIKKDPTVAYRIWERLKMIDVAEIEDEGRVYGGGLKKIEPKELEKVSCENLMEVGINTYSI